MIYGLLRHSDVVAFILIERILYLKKSFNKIERIGLHEHKICTAVIVIKF